MGASIFPFLGSMSGFSDIGIGLRGEGAQNTECVSRSKTTTAPSSLNQKLSAIRKGDKTSAEEWSDILSGG